MVDIRLTAFDKNRDFAEAMTANRWHRSATKSQGRKMRIILKVVKWLLALVVLASVALAAWLYVAPPELIRVGSGYSAKIVCSNVFIAGRDAGEVLAVDVQAPGHPLLKLMKVSV